MFQNSGSNDHHWLGVRLQGVASSRDGAGAKLRLTAGRFVSYDQVIGGRSYCSARDPRIRFGLAERARVDELEVSWLSGKRQVLTDLPADRYIVLAEGPALP